MNMNIATGIAGGNENINIGHSAIGSILEPLLKLRACVSGLLSVNPSGKILPCSNYAREIGSLLKKLHSYMKL